MTKLCFILFFTGLISFGQTLEETIYSATETFISNQNSASFRRIESLETVFKDQVKTKDEQLALVFLQSHKGYYLNNSSKLEAAISTYEDAIKRFNSNALSGYSDFDIIENCLKPLGNLYIKTGNYTNAISTINQYIFLAEKSNQTPHQISGGINLAKLYYSIGNYDMVFKIVNTYINHSNASKDQKQKLREINLESQIASGKLLDYTTFSNSLHSSNNYKIALQKGDYAIAFSEFQKFKNHIISNKKLSKRNLAKLHVEEAQLYLFLNKPKATSRSLQTALTLLLPNFKGNGLPNKSDLYAENTFIDIFDLYAEMESRPERALQSFDLSFHVAHLLENSWTSQETKILNETNNRIRSEKCIDILYNLYKQTKNKDLLLKAFQYSENSKASTLKEMFLIKKRLKQYPEDSLLQKEFGLLKAQERITSLLIKEQLEANRPTIINDLSMKLQELSVQIKSLKTVINQSQPLRNDIFEIKELQDKLLEDQAVLVAYFWGNKTLYQFTVSNKTILLNQMVLNESFKRQILDFIHLFDEASVINNNIENFTNKAYKLFKSLDLQKLSGNKNIVIIPDGLLNFVPFETLLSAETSTTSFVNMPFWFKSQSIAYNSSAFFYLATRVGTRNDSLLGFFPVFENTNKQLVYSIEEAKAIENEMPSSIFINTKATLSNFLKNASKYNTIHLSTHASSGDFVKPATIDFYDDTLNLNELYSLNLDTHLIVLSACETGVGKLYKGEGAMSIARGFQYAGAENLVFSLWPINDLSTSQLMQSFYKNLNTSHSAFYSNRQSKLDYLQDNGISNIKKSPYYWGAFVYYGALEPDKSQGFVFYVVLGVLFVLVLLFLIFKSSMSDKRQ